jgi:hypothetical protein
MRAKTITSIIILTNLILSSGCSYKLERITLEEIKTENKYVSEVELLNNEVVRFYYGGDYEIIPDILEGKLEDGTDIVLSREDISEFRTTIANSISPNLLKEKSITEILLKDNSVVIFNDRLAFFSLKEMKTGGVTFDNEYIEVDNDSILAYYIERPEKLPDSVLQRSGKIKLAQVVMNNGKVYNFNNDEQTYTVIQDVISGENEISNLVKIPVDSILNYSIKRTDYTTSIASTTLSITILLILITIVMAR